MGLYLGNGISQMQRKTYPVRVYIRSAHDARNERHRMRIPRFQIDMQHVQGLTSFFPRQRLASAVREHRNPFHSTGKGYQNAFKTGEGFLKLQARSREYIHFQIAFHAGIVQYITAP